ncbi:MAG: AAA family ATPase [Proteobacteria bacterium]|nr:AAA family ATPase [Pseudomonadota bacterium]
MNSTIPVNLMAVYGRRRVGKTYLIKKYFQKKDCDFFSTTGLDHPSFKLQRTAFCSDLSKIVKSTTYETPNSWFKIFELLDAAVNRSQKEKFVIFLDELPWMVARKSQFLETLEYFQ